MAEENIIVEKIELEYDSIDIKEESQDVIPEETVDIVEVDDVEVITVDMDEAFSALGETNEQLKHSLLNGRELSDQHPISAITGLREELDGIQALQTVYSDEKQVADYYEWEDGNVIGENRVGYFVSVCDDIRMIKVCTGEDIFGVTVDSAAFIGGQDDIPRDVKYALVTHSGIVHVRCELDVEVGDFVISNSYGMATKSDGYGCKVIALHEIDGVLYAAVSLGISINQIDSLGNEVDSLADRMSEAEKDIVASINVAQQAFNKAGEVGEVSEEAIKNALEALEKANDTSEKTDEFEERLENANELAVQAQAIALSASNSALAIKDEAIKTANDALTNVNDLIKDLEPITTWTDPETGNTGAEYFTTYVKDGVATKVEVQTVETLTNDNKSAIEKSAEKFNTLIASIDKYSVGEYSQSYGLTREQATSILKIGMIYVPTKHSHSDSHSEIFVGESDEQWFTPGSYYEWNINDQGVYDWIEYKDSVAFFSEEPSPSRVLTYWYIDSDTAPEGYEPYALYMYDDKWVKVNIFYNNPSNRIVSSISQEVDNISLEIINARGSYAGLDARLTNVDSQLQLATFWNNPDSEKSNLAAVNLNSSDDGSNLALVVMNKDGEQQLNGASIILGQNNEDSYIQFDADNINFKGHTIDLTANDIEIKSKTFNVTKDGYMTTTGGELAGWTFDNRFLYKLGAEVTDNDVKRNYAIAFDVDGVGQASRVFKIGKIDEITGNWGPLDDGFSVDGFGNMRANSGTMGNFTISSAGFGDVSRAGTNGSGIWFEPNPTEGSYFINCTNYGDDSKYFRVGQDGILYASGADISGIIRANDGYVGNFTLSDGNLVADTTYSYNYGNYSQFSSSLNTTSLMISDKYYDGGYPGKPYFETIAQYESDKITMTRIDNGEDITTVTLYTFKWTNTLGKTFEYNINIDDLYASAPSLTIAKKEI